MTLGVFRRTEISRIHAINFFEFSRNPLVSEIVTLGSFYKKAIFWLHDIMFFRRGFDFGRRDIMFRAPRALAEAFSVRCRGTR